MLIFIPHLKLTYTLSLRPGPVALVLQGHGRLCEAAGCCGYEQGLWIQRHVLVIYCRVTNYPQALQLNTAHICYLTVLMGKESTVVEPLTRGLWQGWNLSVGWGCHHFKVGLGRTVFPADSHGCWKIQFLTGCCSESISFSLATDQRRRFPATYATYVSLRATHNMAGFFLQYRARKREREERERERKSESENETNKMEATVCL